MNSAASFRTSSSSARISAAARSTRSSHGKAVPVVELNLRKLGEIVDARLLKIDLLPAEQNIERMPEPGGGPSVDETLPRESVEEKGLELPGVARAHRLGARELVAQRSRHLARGWGDPNRELVKRRRAALVAKLGQLVPLEDQCVQVARLEGERLVDGGHGSRLVVESATGVVEADADRDVGRTRGDDPLERLACRARVAPAQGVGAGLRERARVDGGLDMGEDDSLSCRAASLSAPLANESIANSSVLPVLVRPRRQGLRTPSTGNGAGPSVGFALRSIRRRGDPCF